MGVTEAVRHALAELTNEPPSGRFHRLAAKGWRDTPEYGEPLGVRYGADPPTAS